MILKIHISVFLVCLYCYLTKSLEIFLLSYLFIILHELVHMIVALLFKIDIVEISLTPFGAIAKYKGLPNLVQEFLISIAGPIASLFFALVYQNSLYFSINICILFFNLIPIYPMDGGRILRVILISIFGKRKGYRMSYSFTTFLLVLLFFIALFMGAYFKNFSLLIVSIYFINIAKKEIQKDKIIKLFNYLQNT